MGDVAAGVAFGGSPRPATDGTRDRVEDRAFEGSLEKRRESLIISRRFLLQHMIG